MLYLSNEIFKILNRFANFQKKQIKNFRFRDRRKLGWLRLLIKMTAAEQKYKSKKFNLLCANYCKRNDTAKYYQENQRNLVTM